MAKIIIIILILGVFLVYPGYLDLRKFNREIVRLDEEIRELKEANENLRAEIKALREDRFYLERVARENLGLVKPGEIIYKIVSSSELKKQARGGAGW
ncbi:septum formation initiator family protein [candidate division NPL-UPA2 bacterium]|nr:septum formation initiator family protein [candidate division NPL-UPA2 bacterium]